MKKIIVIFAGLFISFNLLSQSSTIMAKGNNGMYWQLENVIQTTDGGKLIAGGYDSLSLVKVDNNNQVVWAKSIFTGVGGLKVLLVEKNLNYYVCFQGVNPQDGMIYIMKFDNSGQLLYSKYLFYPNIGANWFSHDDKANVMINNSDEVIITGSFEGMMTLHKLDNSGNLLFGYKICPDTLDYTDIRGYGSVLCNDDGIMLTCKGDTTGIIVKVSPSGIFQWAKSYNVSSLKDCRPRSIIRVTDGNFMISGYVVDLISISGQIPFLMKIDSIGNLIWYNEYTVGQYNDYASADIAEQLNGNFVGYYGTNGVLFETDSVGNITTKKIYNLDLRSLYTYGNQTDIASFDKSTTITNSISQNNCLITDTVIFNLVKSTTTNSVVSNTYSKIESYGMLYNHPLIISSTNVELEQTCATVGIKEESENINIRIFPNPTTSIINIIDENKQFQNSTIEIKNCLGQTVYTSSFTSQISVCDLSAGIYYLNVHDKSRYKTIKIIKQ